MKYEELKQFKKMLEEQTVEYELVASLIADVIDFNPNCDDYWHFESIRLPVIGKRVFYRHSTFTEFLEVINYIYIDDDGRLWIHCRFEAKYRDKKDSEGKDRNEELEMLKFIEKHRIKVVNIPEQNI